MYSLITNISWFWTICLANFNVISNHSSCSLVLKLSNRVWLNLIAYIVSVITVMMRYHIDCRQKYLWLCFTEIVNDKWWMAESVHGMVIDTSLYTSRTLSLDLFVSQCSVGFFYLFLCFVRAYDLSQLSLHMMGHECLHL